MNKEEALKLINKELGNKYGKVIKELGAGNNGVVFQTDKNFAIKVTSDKEEFTTTQKVFNSVNGKFTPTYSELKDLGNPFIIVMDKIEPIQISASQNSFLNSFRDKLLDIIEAGEDPTYLKKALVNVPGDYFRNILSGIIDCVYGLKKIGIENADIQEGNIGINKQGKIVLVDVVDSGLLVERKVSSLIEKLQKITGKKVILK